MAKIVNIIGTRPQYVKFSLLSKELDKHFNCYNIDTGQHYDDKLSKQLLKDLDLTFNKTLSCLGLDVNEQLGYLIIKLNQILLEEKPDIVIVYGDTTSSLAGAISASKLGVKLVHIEAGMRAEDCSHEQNNRILIDNIACLLLTPTTESFYNLVREGKKNIVNVGDLMYDVFKETKGTISGLSDFFLCTIHRRENLNKDRLKYIMEELGRIPYEIIIPLHPHTKSKLIDIEIPGNVTIIPPCNYSEIKGLLVDCIGVITDSGGLQKEAYFAKRRCFTVRKETEWKETLDNNCNILCYENISEAVKNKKQCSFVEGLYGNGKAYIKITNELRSLLC